MHFIGSDYLDEFSGDSIYMGDDLADVFAGEEMILAGDEIIGVDELGRVVRKAKRPLNPAQKLRALALAKAAGGAATRPKERNNVFEQPLPIPRTSVGAGLSADIELRPQRLFRSERLVVPSTIAAFFDITDVKIGQQTQFVASGALPATIFSEVGVGVRLKGDTANLGNTIVVSVTNNDVATQVFGGAIIGTVII